jgi:hypothetical protein
MADVLIELNDDVIALLKLEAELRGCSFNELILALLDEAAGVTPHQPDEIPHRTTDVHCGSLSLAAINAAALGT